MKNLLVIIFMLIVFPNAFAAGVFVDPEKTTDLGDTTVPSRLVCIQAPDGTRHYLLGSHHERSVEEYIASKDLRNKVFGADRLYTERDTNKVLYELTCGALHELNAEEKAPEVKGKTWFAILLEDDEECEGDIKIATDKFHEFVGPRKKVLQTFDEPWGIAYFTMLCVLDRFDRCLVHKKDFYERNPDSATETFCTTFEAEVEEFYRGNGKRVGFLETSRSFFLDVFSGLRFITEEEGKEELSTDYGFFLRLLFKSFLTFAKSDEAEEMEAETETSGADQGGGTAAEKAEIESVDLEATSKNTIFDPNTFSFEGDYFDRGARKRDLTMSDAIIQALTNSSESALFVAGADHLFGIVHRLSPWLSEQGYALSFVRRSESDSGYEFVPVLLNEAGDTYKFAS